MSRSYRWFGAVSVVALVLAGVLTVFQWATYRSPWSGAPGTWGTMMGNGRQGSWAAGPQAVGGSYMGGMGGMHAWMSGGYGVDQVPSPSPATPPGTQRQDISVAIREWQMEPGTLTVQTGSRIRLIVTNQGTVAHDFAIADLGLRLVNIAPGDRKVVELDLVKSGAFAFFCDIPGHAQLGQRGVLNVGP